MGSGWNGWPDTCWGCNWRLYPYWYPTQCTGPLKRQNESGGCGTCKGTRFESCPRHFFFQVFYLFEPKINLKKSFEPLKQDILSQCRDSEFEATLCSYFDKLLEASNLNDISRVGSRWPEVLPQMSHIDQSLFAQCIPMIRDRLDSHRVRTPERIRLTQMIEEVKLSFFLFLKIFKNFLNFLRNFMFMINF